jgi:pilus assembly protein CpaB
MNKNVLIVLAGAVLIAVLMAVLVQMMLGGNKQPAPVVAEAEPRTEILVAARDLKTGAQLKAGDTKWQSWPRATLFAGAIVRSEGQTAEEALEGRLRRDVSSGEPMMQAYLLGQSKGNLVAAMLDPGQRAVSIQVSATTMVAGFVAPGDFVDIVLTYRPRITVDDELELLQQMVDQNVTSFAAETILENVRVLAIDQTATRPDEDKIKVGRTVTLALSVQETEKVILAQKMGELTLVLRGVGDEQPISREWPITSDNRIVNIIDEIIKNYHDLKNEAGIQSNNVRIYSGDDVQVISTR